MAVCFLAVSVTAALAQEDARIAGEYRAVDSFEMFQGLLLRPDGTFAYALSVGALDQRSSGTWTRHGDSFELVTTPKPVPPRFVQGDASEDADAPFVQVTWPNGRGIAGIDVVLGCRGREPVGGYTQEDGWSPPSGDCPHPEWIELVEPIHETRSARIAITEPGKALRF
ncbi:MAG: hypothetical protein AB7U34_01410, partial [Novosphingobium sp.]